MEERYIEFKLIEDMLSNKSLLSAERIAQLNIIKKQLISLMMFPDSYVSRNEISIENPNKSCIVLFDGLLSREESDEDFKAKLKAEKIQIEHYISQLNEIKKEYEETVENLKKNPVEDKKIEELLKSKYITATDKEKLEAMLAQQRAQQQAEIDKASTYNRIAKKAEAEKQKAEEKLKAEKQAKIDQLQQAYKRLHDLVDYYTKVEKTSLTDYEISFRKNMLKQDGTGLIQQLFACIEKDPRYAKSTEYTTTKKAIVEMLEENPFNMKKFIRLQDKFMSAREKYIELEAKEKELKSKGNGNYAEISQVTSEISKVSSELNKLKQSMVTEANKYRLNQNRLETLYENYIVKLSKLGNYSLSAERDKIIAQIKEYYVPFAEKFNAKHVLKQYTQDLAKVEAQMKELGISPIANSNNPNQPGGSIDPDSNTHSGLHFIGFPDREYYDSVRNIYRYGDEIQIEKEEEIDGKTYITLKGSDVKIPKNLFATTAEIEKEFKRAMKSPKLSTNKIKAGMKVTPCWPGHYNRAILKHNTGRNEADIEIKKMKLHDEIEVEKVFNKGLKKYVKLVGYETAFSADSFAIAPSTIKELAEKKEAAKKAREEERKNRRSTPENAAPTATPTAATVQESQAEELETTPAATPGSNPEQSVSDILNAANQTNQPEGVFMSTSGEPVIDQDAFDEAYEKIHGRKPVIAEEPSYSKVVKQGARVGAIAGIADDERTTDKVRNASMWSLVTSKAGQTIKGKIVDIAQKIVDKAQTQGASEEELKEAMDIQAEAARQSGVEPAKQQQELSI